MSISGSNAGNNKGQQQTQARTSTPTSMGGALADAQAAQQHQGYAAQQPQSAGFSWRSPGSLMRAPMGRTQASEVLTKTAKALNALFDEAVNGAFEVKTLPIAAENTENLSVSVLVVCVRQRDQLENGVAYHTLILEGSAEPIAPRFEMINGRNTEITKVAGDAFDAIMERAVLQVVQDAYPGANLFNVEACVVPRGFDLADTQSLYALASNAVFAAATELESKTPGFQDLNLAAAKGDANLQVRTSYGNPQIRDAVGAPVRADIDVSFSATPLNQGQANVQHGVDRVQQLASVGGYLDLVWNPQQAVPGPYQAYQSNTPPSFQRYVARFVMTNLESTKILTIPAQLLALVTALTLDENNAWTHAFRPQQFVGDSIDMNDIGAVGIEVNFDNDPSGFGRREDTKSDGFKPENLHRLVEAVIQKGLLFSLDVPECSPQTWYNSVFAHAARGNNDAVKAIVDAANTLTNGNFSKYYDGSQIATDENNRIHLGYYTDRNGVKQDIRNIHYLAVMNMVGEKDPTIIRAWSDTFSNVFQPLETRLADRKKIITGLVSDAVFTGFATRVTFNKNFLEALARGCVDAGLQMRAISPYADNGSYERAGNQFVNNNLMSGGATGVFSRGGFGGGQASGFQRQFSGRQWGQ